MTKNAIILNKPLNKMSIDEREQLTWLKEFFQLYERDENGSLRPVEELLDNQVNDLAAVRQNEKKPRHNGRG